MGKGMTGGFPLLTLGPSSGVNRDSGSAQSPSTRQDAPGSPEDGTFVGYYRFPTVYGRDIVFTCEDDLWRVPIDGGIAVRLTVSQGVASMPIFSPDGNWIAYLGTDEGAREVYVVAATGGKPRRLTHFGSVSAPVGWTPDSKHVVFITSAGQPLPWSGYELYKVPVTGGPPESMKMGPAVAITFEPEGHGVAIARNGGDPARWKRYRGGQVGTIWVDEKGTGRFKQILKHLQGNFASPMWTGGRIYFLSDHEGFGNIYSCRPNGTDIRRHTDHRDFYARFPSTDGKLIVYHAGADLWLLDLHTGENRKIDVRVTTTQPQRQRRILSGAQYLEDYDVHPAGHSILLTLRGRPVTMGLWEGPATEFGVPWQGRHRLARWLNDGKRFVAITDEDGEECLEIFTPPEGREKLRLRQNLGRVVELQVAPDPPARPRGRRKARKARTAGRRGVQDRIAVANHRSEILVVDLKKKQVKKIDRSPYGPIEGFCWSPDGRWLAYAVRVSQRRGEIRIADVKTGRKRTVTSGDFIDYAPCFDPTGKYLYFLSLRTYTPLEEIVRFEIAIPKGARPYLITLRKDLPSPLAPAPRPLGPAKVNVSPMRNPWEVAAEAQSGEGKEGKPSEEVSEVTIDFDGITDRIQVVPIPEGRYSAVQACADRVFVLSHPLRSTDPWQHQSSAAPAASIEMFDFRDLRHSTFASSVGSFKIGRDGKTLAYRSGARLRAVLATGEPPKGGPNKEETSRKTGWIDLARVRCVVEPAREWRQMLGEAWRLQRDNFWTPDMSAIDWKSVYERYLPLVERVLTRGELSDLIWEMQGELGTSHAYEFGGDYRRPPTYPVGFLGVDFRYDRKRRVWRIARILKGDPWNPEVSSPLAAPGLGVAEEAAVTSIAGVELSEQTTPWEALVHRAGTEVWLSVTDAARPRSRRRRGTAKTVSVKTLANEFPLRYRDWVERNRAWVHEHSKGRVGYIHVPDMGMFGYSEFSRYFMAEIDHEGLIVDVRYNAGGNISQMLLERLMRKRIGASVSRHHGLEPYPSEAPRGPMVAIANEGTGSDGDIFCHAWKRYGLGPLVGKRTWGGVIGIWPRHGLVDGSITSQPEYAFWFDDVGWRVENYGVDPDIEVDLTPQDFGAGRDPQLERALKEVMKMLRGFKEARPDLRRRPKLKPPKLPPRKR